MRLLPRSLFGRLLLLLTVGLVVAQLLSASILLYDRDQVLSRAVGGGLGQRIGAIVELLDTLPPARRQQLLAGLKTPSTRVYLDKPWRRGESAYARQAALFATLLRRYLPANRKLHVEIADPELPPRLKRRLEHLPVPERRARLKRFLRTREFIVQVELLDGGVLTFSQRLPEEVFDWPLRALLVLAILLVSVAALSVLAVRWLTRPLGVLAKAAAELGRNIHRPALAETGPLEVQRAARAFNTMQARLGRYIEDRSRILAAVSHDLKTPITRLRLRAELLQDRQIAAKLQTDLDDMEAMVQATLDFMRGADDNEPLAAIDINALLESLQEDTLETGGRFGIEGAAKQPFQGRPLALKRCLNNLISNALDYGQTPVIRVRDTAERLLISVRDKGPGIPDAQLERVFEPFYRLEGSRSRHTGGTGLGLGIARNIARAHGGELTLRNRIDGGLEAMLDLPR